MPAPVSPENCGKRGSSICALWLVSYAYSASQNLVAEGSTERGTERGGIEKGFGMGFWKGVSGGGGQLSTSFVSVCMSECAYIYKMHKLYEKSKAMQEAILAGIKDWDTGCEPGKRERKFLVKFLAYIFFFFGFFPGVRGSFFSWR